MKTCIEVGAFDGSDSLRFHNEGYIVFAFEPKKDLYENLYNKTKNLNNFFLYNKAISLNNGITKFNICKQGGASSILEFRPDDILINNWEGRTDILYNNISYDVETIRLDKFIEDNNLENIIIDYIHIDAQGVDLDVLKSLGKYISNVKRGVLETVMDYNRSIYINQYDNIFENVKKFLETNNFEITNIVSNDSANNEYNVYFRSI